MCWALFQDPHLLHTGLDIVDIHHHVPTYEPIDLLTRMLLAVQQPVEPNWPL
jgi:hypothetical protein